jgi:hypothetical protein
MEKSLIKIGNMSCKSIAIQIKGACHPNLLATYEMVTYISSAKEIKIKILDIDKIIDQECDKCDVGNYGYEKDLNSGGSD